MDRKTIKIKTPISGDEVELNEWITGAEAEYIDQPMSEAFAIARIKVAMKEPVDMRNASAVDNHRTLEKFVVSINGSKENIVDRIAAWNEADCFFVVNKCNTLRIEFKKKAEMMIKCISPESAS